MSGGTIANPNTISKKMSNLLKKHIEDKKYLLIFLFWLLFGVWRVEVFLNPVSELNSGSIEGMAFASHHSYQRGIKAHLTRTDLSAGGAQAGKAQQKFIFPLSYSGSFKAYNIPPGKYQIVFTKLSFHSIARNIIVRASSVTKIPPITLERSLGSDYFYHFAHTLNIFAFAFLLITGIGTYYLRRGDYVAKAFLRFCLIMSFWSLWGIVSYVLEPLGKKEIGGHLTYLSLWAYSFIGVSYCHVFVLFPEPVWGEKTKRFLCWLYFPAFLLFPFEFIRVFFWYRPDYSRFLGFPQQITDVIIMLFSILYLVLGNALLLFNLLRVKEKVQKIQLLFLFLAACVPPVLFAGTLGTMYLFHLDYFFDNDLIFFTSLSQIIVSVSFAYSLVMFDYIHTNERMVQQERLAFIGLMDAKLTHDIRSLIVVGRNLSQTLHQLILENKYHKENLLSLTSEMEENANKTLQLISSIRAELKQDKPQYSYANIEEMVDEAVEIVKCSTIKKINIKRYFRENLPPLRVEKTRFVHALVNLLQNAVDSLREKGDIEITGLATDEEITLAIKDNGCGIKEDKKDKIFESFYTTKENNTGLGLFFVEKEIQRYNGTITCLSKPAVGTTMIITLPYPVEDKNSDNQTGIIKRLQDYAKA